MAIIIAKISLASVNSVPKTGTISRNMEGSMSGDAKQNAITGASGTPAISSPAMIGTTPQEQNGDRAPKRDAIIIDLKGCPDNTILIC